MPDLHASVLPFVQALHAKNRPQVWSVVVTIFGDAVLHRGGRIAMQDLQSLTAPMEISESALRTAISRLASEGWLIGERQGRNSFYSLSPDARAQTLKAAEHVYRPHTFHTKQNWIIGIGGTKEPKGAIQLAKSAWLLGDAPIPPEMLIIQGRANQIPDWAIEAIIPPNRAAQTETLLTLLNNKIPTLHAKDALILRILVLHFWRKIALGLGSTVFEIACPDWPLVQCFKSVASTYKALFEISETALPNLPSHPAPNRF